MTSSKDVTDAGVRILIVEDSPTQAEQLTYLLEENGYRVTAAATGTQALVAARREKPALILSDIVMPEMDGYAFCKAVKSDDQLKDVPVILMTSLSSAGDVVKGLQCGADNFIRKPYEDKYLLARINYALTNRTLRSTEKLQIGVHILLGGERHFITADRQQILDLLISTYEEAVHLNEDLKAREEQLARANRTLAGLYRIAKTLNTATSEQEVVEQVLERAIELPGVQAGWIILREGDAAFRLAGARGLPPALHAPGAMEGDCLCRRRLLSGELSQVANIQECERLQKAQGDTRGLRCHASIPLWVGDRTVGLMNLVGSQEGLFRDEELQVLNGIGNQIALALARTQLHAELERRVEERTAALQRSEERYRTLTESAEDVIFVLDREARVEYINTAGASHFGAPSDRIVGRRLSDLFPADVAEPLGANVDRVYGTGKSVRTEDRLLLQNREQWFDMRLVPIKEQHETFRTIFGIGRNITEQRRLTQQFQQAQKMEAVGQLAGGVAHDFNNLLSAILGYSELLLEEMSEDDRRRQDLEQIQKAGRSAELLTRQLLAFSRKQILEPVVLDLNDIVGNVDRMVRRLIGENIKVIARLDPELGRVKADAGQIEQIIVNLAVNARDAMPEGGTLTIETANVDLDEHYAHTHPSTIPGRHVMLAVSDTGTGMDEQTQSHLFEPFFTTKEKGKGTGLGLATVYGIVKQSGGSIWVYSEPGHGTSFKIYLSRVEGAAAGPPVAARLSVRTPTGTETVLLVEDHDGLRALARKILERYAYIVLEAANGDEALRIGESHHGTIHLLLTDVVMPGMSGHALADRLSVLRPAMRCLYTSGYTDDAIVHHGVLAAGTAFLQKPYTPETLARKVRAVLDAQE